MDYNWLENVPSSLTPIPVYQPDFGFLQSMQMKANQQYEQGFKEVKTAYSSLFNKKVTGEEATKRQQDYSKQALDQMKAIAATDLSDPKNVQIAEDILSPFYKDNLYLKNIASTSDLESQFGKLESMRTSKNKEERLLYRSWVSEYLNQGVEELASAPMTKEAYDKLERREAFPVYDIGTDAAKEFDDLYGKDGFTTTDLNGNIMKTTKNGPKSVAAFSTLYKSVASREKYTTQLKAYAVTEMGRAIKDIKQKNPGLTTEQAKAKFGENAVTDLKFYYGSLISDANKTALEIRNKNVSLIPLDANGWPKEKLTFDGVKDKAKLQQIIDNYADAKKYQDLADNYKKEFTSSFGYIDSDKNKYSTSPFDFSNSVDIESEQYKKTVNDIKTRPEDYIANVYVDHDADKWAKGKAIMSSVKYEVNPITKAFDEQTNKQFDQQMKVLQFQALLGQKNRSFDLEQVKTMQKLGIPIDNETLKDLIPDYPGYKDDDVFNANTGFGSSGGAGGGGGGSKGRGIPSIGSGTVSAPGTDNVKVPTLDNFNIDQARRINTVNALSFSLEGNLQAISSNVINNGLKPEEIIDLAGDLQNCIQTGNYSSKPEAVTIRQKFVDVLNSNNLNSYTKNGTSTNPNDFRRGLSALINSNTTQKFFISADPKNISTILNIARQNKVVEKEMSQYLKYDKEYKERIVKFVNTGNNKKDFKPVLKTVDDPKTGEKVYDIIDSKDIADDFKKLGVYDVTAVDKTGNVVSFSNEQLANFFLQNDISFPLNKGTTYDFKIGDMAYNLNSIGKIKYDKGDWYSIGGNRGEMMKVLLDAIGNPATDVVSANLIGGVDSKGYGLIGKYGQPKEIKTLLDKISKEVIQKIPGYSTGLSGSVMTYDISGEGKEIDPTQKATGIKLAQEAFLPNNFDKIYTVDGTNKMDEQLEKDTKAALINHTSWETSSDLFESIKYHPQGPNGKAAIEVVFSGTKEGDGKRKIGSATYTDLKTLGGGGRIFIDIAEGAKGDLIKSLPEQKSSYRYGQLLYSTEPITQDGFEENSGFRYKIKVDHNSKDATGRYTKAYILSSMWKLNDDGTVKVDDKGNPEWEEQITSAVNLMVGNNPKSPDNIESDINNWMTTFLNRRFILRKANEQNSAPAGNVVDLDNILKQQQLK
jgi:hypothetical protein